VRLAYGSKTNAEIELAKRKEALRDGTYRQKYDEQGRLRGYSSALFRDVAEELFEQRAEDRSWTATTIKKNRFPLRLLTDHFGNRRLTEISRLDVERFRRKQRKRVDGPTVNRYVALLSGLIQVAVVTGEIFANPVHGVGRYEENEHAWSYIQPDLAERLIEACAPRLRPIVLCGIYTGLRATPIRELKWEQVDLRNGLIWVPITKSKRPLEIPIDPILATTLRALKKRATCDYVFIKEDGSRYKDWRRAFARAKKDSGIPSGFRFHDLRHTFGTWLTDAEVHPYAIQDLMGHRSNLMTRRYAHVTARHKRAAM